MNHLRKTSASQALIEIDTIMYFVIEIWNTFLCLLLAHGMMEFIKICPFKTSL